MAMTETEILAVLEENEKLRQRIKILEALNEKAFTTNLQLSEKIRAYEDMEKVRRLSMKQP